MKKTCLVLLFLVLFCGAAVPGQALLESAHPIIDPKPVTYVETEDEYQNILLAGVDYSNAEIGRTSGGKGAFENCHTDVLMVASINKTTGHINLISIPRDTVTYVPGVKGVYKLNAAFNVAEDENNGIRQTCESVSWLLGGVPIHNYMVVDMAALVAMVDAIGGVDFEVDMTYKCNGRYYHKGMQHLDGLGVMDYVRARMNATVDNNDLGRTRRGRDMMIALFGKVKQVMKDEGVGSVVVPLVNIVFGGEYHILTDFTTADLMSLASGVADFSDGDAVGSYVLTGKYTNAFQYWNFTFTDQQHRQQVLKDAFGLEVEEIPYVSTAHGKWMAEYGFSGAKYILVARMLFDYGMNQESLTPEQRDLLTRFEAQHDRTVQAFDKAALSHSEEDTNVLRAEMKELRRMGEEVMKLFKYPKNVTWPANKYWYLDPYINEYPDLRWG